jgi:hypothetical protein
MHYHVRSWGSMALATACWALATGLAVEKVLSDGVQSWTLLAGVPVLTLVAGILLHIGFADIKDVKPVKGTVALVLAMLALAVTLPASIGSSSQARDTAAATATKSAADLEKIKADLTKTEKLVAEAEKWQAIECGTGKGKKCDGVTFVLEQRVRSANALRDDLKAQQPTKSVEAGEERIAWVLGLFGLAISPADVGRVWPILPPLAFELMSAYFLTRGLGRDTPKNTPAIEGVRVSDDTAQTSFPVSEPLPAPAVFGALPEPTAPKPKRRKRKSKHENAAAWLRAEVEKNGGVPSFKVLQGRHHLSKASASRIRKEVMAELGVAA